jgi:porin
MIWRENGSDTQGGAAFGRLGWADEEVQAVEFFASLGLQWCGPIPGRDEDVAGIGWAQGRLSSEANFSASYERGVELYYNAEITPWLHVTPDLQWIANPGGDEDRGDAIVAGVRAQMTF